MSVIKYCQAQISNVKCQAGNVNCQNVIILILFVFWDLLYTIFVFFLLRNPLNSLRRWARYSCAEQKLSLLENFCLSQSSGRIERKSFYWPDSGSADANRSDDNHKPLRFWVNAPPSRQYLTLPPPKMFPSFPNVTYCHSKLFLHVKIVAKHW